MKTLTKLLALMLALLMTVALVACKKDDATDEATNAEDAAQTESVMAGALGISLLGDACYFGEQVRKPAIGEAIRDPEIADIDRANRLVFAASALFFALGLALRIGAYRFFFR